MVKNGRRRRAVSVLVAGVCSAMLATAPAANAKPGVANIHQGSTGFGVKCVQAAINYDMHTALAVDGIDGPKTTKAVRAFQTLHQETVDGIVGPDTGDDIDYYAWNYYSKSCYDYLPTHYVLG